MQKACQPYQKARDGQQLYGYTLPVRGYYLRTRSNNVIFTLCTHAHGDLSVDKRLRKPNIDRCQAYCRYIMRLYVRGYARLCVIGVNMCFRRDNISPMCFGELLEIFGRQHVESPDVVCYLIPKSVSLYAGNLNVVPANRNGRKIRNARVAVCLCVS